MNRRKFLYFLTDSQGQCYYVENGVLKKSAAIKKPLSNSPIGWNEQAIKIARNNTYKGLVPSYTIPLRFVKNSAKILRTLRYGNYKGIEEVVFLVILKLNSLTGTHEYYYKGEIDLSKPLDSINYFEVPVTESGFYKQLKANENLAVEIPLEGIDVVDVIMDGLELLIGVSYITISLEDRFYLNHVVPLAYIQQEGTSFGLVFGSQNYESQTDSNFFKNTNNCVAKNVSLTPITVSYKGDLKVKLTQSDSNRGTYILFYHISTPTTDVVTQIGNFTFAVGQEHTFNINLTNIVLPPNGKLILHGRAYANIPGDSIEFKMKFGEDRHLLNTKTKYRSSKVKAINAYELGNRLIKKVIGVDYLLNSPFLYFSGLYITCGDALRGLEKPVIKTSIKDFFESMDRNLSIGMKCEGKTVNIDRERAFYKNEVVHDCGVVDAVSVSLREDLFGSSIKIGYPDQDYDDVNGKDEFNTTHIYKTPVKRITTEISIQGKYRADPYGIEFTRINLEGKTTTDNKADTDVFILDVVQQGADTVLNRPVYDAITGVLNPTSIFNTRLSPAHLMLVHGSKFRSIFHQQLAGKFEYQTSQKNAELSVTLGGTTVYEKMDFTIGNFTDPYYLPIEVKFKTKVPSSFVSLLSNAYGKVQFTYLGKTFRGFLMDASQKPSGNESQEWTLQLSTDNNIMDLIH